MEEVIEIWRPKEKDDLKLRPCPFCGSEEVVYVKYHHTVGERWKIMCCGCTANIDPGYARERHIVQGMWNRRKTDI